MLNIGLAARPDHADAVYRDGDDDARDDDGGGSAVRMGVARIGGGA